MKISLFRKKKGADGESIVSEEFDKFIEHIKVDTKDGFILRYRDVVDGLDSPEQWAHMDRIARVCAVCEWKKDKDGRRVLVAYNGVSMLVVGGLNNVMEIERVKKQCALFPQVLCAFQGADGHSVVVWTIATLPDGTLPQEESLAELFCAQAYATSVTCLAPALEFPISVEAPVLDKTYLMTVDENPYVNAHPTPFIIEQPTADSVRTAVESSDAVKRLERLKPSAETYVTFNRMYNAAFEKALWSLPNWNVKQDAQVMITRVADMCADCGLPEEEVASRLVFHFYKENEDEVRGAVRNVYEGYEGLGVHTAMKKHQIIALRLREFLQRRYEIRFNDVLQVTEFRTRQSLDFVFRPLGNRELNTIFHEACVEGIEPTFEEVKRLIGSNYTPKFNPITEYIGGLPQWDGKDHIRALAEMVPNDNPHWAQLFSRWFLSMVAHWMNSDQTYANQTAPILIGAQGYRKSTFCRMMLPPELQAFYTDSIDFRSQIEAERYLSRFLLVNIDEYDQLSDSQIAFVKHLFQKTGTNRRRMYEETIEHQRRYASFIGTTNQQEVLRDPTGNRRYLCVEVTAPIHVERAINHAQLYAQAKHLILHNERYWLNDEDERIIKEWNKRFEVNSPLEQMFLTMFAVPKEGEDGVWMSTAEILEKLQSLPIFNKKTDNNLTKLGVTLTKLGVLRSRNKGGALRWVRLRE